jgi:hypothetical protein
MGAVELGRRWLVRFGCVLMVMAVAYVVYNIDDRTVQKARHALQPHLDLHEPPEPRIFGPLNMLVRSNSTAENRAAPTTSKKWKDFTQTSMVDESVTPGATKIVSPGLRLQLNSSEAVSVPRVELTPPPLVANLTTLKAGDLGDLRTFVLFVGFARSGHSIVGSLLDAHPDIIIAHECSALSYMNKLTGSTESFLSLFNRLYRNSHRNAMSGLRSKEKAKKGYTLSMSGSDISWQGRVRRLKVIGDKSGAMTAQQHHEDRSKCVRLARMLNHTFGIPIKVIRVLRNPYDIIATTVVINARGEESLGKIRNSSEPVKYDYRRWLDTQIHLFSSLIYKVDKFVKECPLTVRTIHLADLVDQPHTVMGKLCETLGVECSPEYLGSCEGKVFKSLSKTRYLLNWLPEQIESVARLIGKYPEYSRYSYDRD